MNQREYSIINQQLENVNRCLTLVENSNSLIHQILNNTNNNLFRRRHENRYSRTMHNNVNSRNMFSNNNLFNGYNDNNTTNENNEASQTYVLRFDTLIPNLSNIINTMYDNSNNTRNSYNYRIYNYENNDVSINEIVENYDILDVKQFDLIENPINDICPITRDRFYNTQNVMMIGCCKHIFNKSSLNIWIQNNNTCPSCRTPIRNLNNFNTENQ